MSETRKSEQGNFLPTVKECSLVKRFVQKELHETQLRSFLIKTGGVIYKFACARCLYMCDLIYNLLKSLQRLPFIPAGAYYGFTSLKALRNLLLLGWGRERI